MNGEIIDNLISFPTSNLELIRDAFFQEILKAKEGAPSSLSYLKTQIPTEPAVPDAQKVQVLIVGGTNYYSACFTVGGDGEITNSRRGLMPVIDTLITWVKFISRELEPDVPYLAINFAFPQESVLRGKISDGILLRATKEHRFEGLVGQLVGQITEKYVVNLARKKIIIACANDATCLLLSLYEKAVVSHLVAGVLGTGFNLAFLEDENTAINLEAGNFDKFPLSLSSVLISKNSIHVGQAFEKEIAGKYLYQHYNLLRDKVAPVLTDIMSTKELSDIAEDKAHPGTLLARAIFERSAAYFAAALAGIYRYKNEPTLKCLMDGSLFWDGWRYTANVRKHLGELGLSTHAFQFIRADNQMIARGTAKLITGV